MAQVQIIPTIERDPRGERKPAIHVDSDIVMEQIGNPVTWSICCPHTKNVQYVEIEFENPANAYFPDEDPPHRCRRPVDRDTGRAYINGVVPPPLDPDHPSLPEEDKYTVRAINSNGRIWAERDPKIIKRKP